mmetsp:Transcript_8166/g.11437  ORF Transcript_8166/g.11437 Transcript_8166/m.11437 type:complete len:133 (-) Transcript_8166:38-436(-)
MYQSSSHPPLKYISSAHTHLRFSPLFSVLLVSIVCAKIHNSSSTQGANYDDWTNFKNKAMTDSLSSIPVFTVDEDSATNPTLSTRSNVSPSGSQTSEDKQQMASRLFKVLDIDNKGELTREVELVDWSNPMM